MIGIDLNFWDILLIAVASIHATAIAYLPSPKAKAWLLCLPTTFSVSFLALGRPLGPANVLGLVLLLLFTNGVRILYLRWQLPIVMAIIVSALGYCLVGSILVPWLPSDGRTFWGSWVAVLVLALVLNYRQGFHKEPSHRSPLPMIVKFPIVVGVILLLLVIKNQLQGFLTLFPMVGVVGAYEARHSLWTSCRQIPVFIVLFLPMLATMYLTQARWGAAGALIMGLLVFGAMMWTYAHFIKTKNQEQKTE